MKRMIALLLCACMALSLAGCGETNSSEEVSRLRFQDSASLETLQALDGKSVSITGYMATLSPLDGEYIYLMNMPYQSCPFCVPNTSQLSNTMAVFAADGVRFDFTDRPIQITGTLRVADKVDDYGYSYNYYIDGASYQVVDLSNVSEEYTLYYSLAEDGVISDVNTMFDYLMFVCQWTEYISSYTDESGNEISYYLYPGDAENILADEGAYGYAVQASVEYFPSLIRRVQAISADGLSDLTDILYAAQKLEQRARAELAEGQYSYDAEVDKYTLTNDQELYDGFYAVYLSFSNWLAKYEL